MKKRILSMLLALTMLVGMIPATTLTASAETLPEITGLHRGVLADGESPDMVYWDAVSGVEKYEVKVTQGTATEIKIVNDSCASWTEIFYGSSTIIKDETFTVEVTGGYSHGNLFIYETDTATIDIATERQPVKFQTIHDYTVVRGETYTENLWVDQKFDPDFYYGINNAEAWDDVSGYPKFKLVEAPAWIQLWSNSQENGWFSEDVYMHFDPPADCTVGTYEFWIAAATSDVDGLLIHFKLPVNVYQGEDTQYWIQNMSIESPNAPEYWDVWEAVDAFDYLNATLIQGKTGTTYVGEDAEEILKYTQKVHAADEYYNFRPLVIKLQNDDGQVVGNNEVITVGRYRYHYSSETTTFRNPAAWVIESDVYYDENIKVYLDGKLQDVVVEEKSVEYSNVKTAQWEFYGPWIYTYDVKPEIHSVNVNGTSVADGASYNSNSKNVTIKTTYDSTLSAAMLEYGCTSVKALSQWYVNGVKVNKAAVSPVDNGNGTETKTLTHTLNSGDVLEIRNWLEVTWPDGTTDIVDEHTMTVTGPISEVNVGATWSGTPANATSNTDGITVTGTQWYRQNGSTWTALTSSDTIKEGYTYRCEVTVAATDGYTLADGYTVKINGTAATKKSGNTWYRDVTITGISDYVDVDEIGVPEAYTNPVFTYDTSDVAPSRKHWDVVQVEWFECDKDGHKLSGALTENDVFQKDTYYRVEVTVVPETNWQFHGSDIGFYINGKAANYLYGYNKAYADSVTGYLVYNTADIEGTYTLYVYDNSLTGSAKDILIEDGQYLGSDATAPTTTQPASGGYAYYKNGVLLLNNYNNEDAHFVFEEGMLDLYLKGDNTIGAICDHSYLNVSSALDGYRDGSLTIDGEETASLFVAGDALDGYCSIFVQNELYINGGDITVTLGENYGDAVYAGGGVTVADDYTVYVNSTGNDFAAAHKWDGSVSLDKYHTVWFKDLKHQFTTQPTGGIVATGDTHTVSWKTNFTPEQIIVEAWKSSGGSYKASREYYSGTTTSVELPALSSGGHYYIIAVYDDGSITSDVVYVTEAQAITDVTLSVVDPVAGKNPSFTVTLPQDAPYEHAVNEAFWIDRTDSSKALTETDTFVAGHEYIVTVRLKAKDGYRFLKDESDITVNVGNTQDFIKRLVINENEYLEVVFVLTATDGSQSSGVTVNCIGDIDYTVSGNVVTVDHEVACKVGYLDGTAYKAITAVANGDGTYSFTAPAGVTEVLLVVKGDANGDGNITKADSTRIKAVFNNKTTLSATALFAANVNSDDAITKADSTRVKAVFNGKTSLDW